MIRNIHKIIIFKNKLKDLKLLKKCYFKLKNNVFYIKLFFCFSLTILN